MEHRREEHQREQQQHVAASCSTSLAATSNSVSSSRPGTAQQEQHQTTQQQPRPPTHPPPHSVRTTIQRPRWTASSASPNRIHSASSVRTTVNVRPATAATTTPRPPTVPSAYSLARATSAAMRRREEATAAESAKRNAIVPPPPTIASDEERRPQRKQQQQQQPKPQSLQELFSASILAACDSEAHQQQREGDQQHRAQSAASLGDAIFKHINNQQTITTLGMRPVSGALDRHQQHGIDAEEFPFPPPGDADIESRPATAPRQQQQRRSAAGTTSMNKVQVISPSKSVFTRALEEQQGALLALQELEDADENFDDDDDHDDDDNDDDHDGIDHRKPSRHSSNVSAATTTKSQNKNNLSRQGSGLLRRRSSSLLYHSDAAILAANKPPAGPAPRLVTRSVFFDEEDITTAVPPMVNKKTTKKRRSPPPSSSSARRHSPSSSSPAAATLDQNDDPKLETSIQRRRTLSAQRNISNGNISSSSRKTTINELLAARTPSEAHSDLKQFIKDFRVQRFASDEKSARSVQNLCSDRRWGRGSKREFVMHAVDRCGPDSKFKSPQQALSIILDGSKEYSHYLLRRVALEKELETRREWFRCALRVLRDVCGFSPRVPRIILQLVVVALLPLELHPPRSCEEVLVLTTTAATAVAVDVVSSSSQQSSRQSSPTPRLTLEQQQQQQEHAKEGDEGNSDSASSSHVATALWDEIMRVYVSTDFDFAAAAKRSRMNAQEDAPCWNTNDAQTARGAATQTTADIRLPVLSESNFREHIVDRIPERELLYPDVQLLLRVVARGFNVTYSELRQVFCERSIHFHLPGGNLGM